jgi:hypothetical protein
MYATTSFCLEGKSFGLRLRSSSQITNSRLDSFVL